VKHSLVYNGNPVQHPDVKNGKIGVLLINLGTPEGTDYKSLRVYLKEFLTDKRVIEWSPWKWYPILFGIVLNTRPQKVGKAYKSIWNNELNESYLRTFTRNQASLIAEKFNDNDNIIIDWAMRYGKPSVADRVDALQRAGCERIVIFPLYPQYAAATSASVNDAVYRKLLTMRWQPAIRTVPPYYDDPVYIDALYNSVTQHLGNISWMPEVIVASFHGIPQSYFDKGDPYYCHCMKTARLLRERLGMSKEQLIVTFQSRFGPEEWIKPYTDKTIQSLAESGVKKIAVITPGFVSDCLETLEEIAVENRDYFMEHGGEEFTFIPCLNDSELGIKVLESVLLKEMCGLDRL
jgi:ferrochelatase